MAARSVGIGRKWKIISPMYSALIMARNYPIKQFTARWMPPMLTSLKYVLRTVSKGNTYLYYRRAGLKLKLPGPEGSAAFLKAYKTIHNEFERSDAAVGAGTLGKAVEFYLSDPKSPFRQVNPRSRADYRRTLDDIRTEFGTIPVQLISLLWVEELRAKYLELPGRWNTIRTRMKSVWDTYRKYHPKVITEDPWRDAKALPMPRSTQNRRWPDDVLVKVLSEATPEFRLLLIVLLLTSQRISDAVSLRITSYDKTETTLRFVQKKTSEEMVLHVPPVLAALLEKWPEGRDVLLTTPRGVPWTVQNAEETLLTMRARLKLPRYTLHGLRATGPQALKMMGAENRAIRALTGHTSDKNLEVYLAGTDDYTLAKQVQTALANRFSTLIEKGLSGNQHKSSGLTGKAAARAGVVGSARKNRERV
jgi:integrase